jgi:hypothetical protein
VLVTYISLSLSYHSYHSLITLITPQICNYSFCIFGGEKGLGNDRRKKGKDDWDGAFFKEIIGFGALRSIESSRV